MRKNPKKIMIDVRGASEYQTEHIPGAILLSLESLQCSIPAKVPDKKSPIVCYCGSGQRSLAAKKMLGELGYTDVTSLEGGLKAWKEAGHPIEKSPSSFSEEERHFYSRHFTLPEVGEMGQQKLKRAKILIVGAGGLGSPAATYLAAAGVGTLGLVDFDVVEISNLQRQILHNTKQIGNRKVDSAREMLLNLNPNIEVIPHPVKLTAENAEAIFKAYDLILDGSDNFPTRYVINDTCCKLRKPFVHGSIYRFEGQVSVFWPGLGPCYRCLYPEPPPPELAPSCAEAGVLGVLPGVIGTLQAAEALKIILEKGKILSGRLLCFDALKTTFREIKLKKDLQCIYCG